MTEINAVMVKEVTSLSAQSISAAVIDQTKVKISNSEIISATDEKSLQDSKNDNDHQKDTHSKLEAMDVDGDDITTEEDDSQITSSTENDGDGGREVVKCTSPSTSTDNTRESANETNDREAVVIKEDEDFTSRTCFDDAAQCTSSFSNAKTEGDDSGKVGVEAVVVESQESVENNVCKTDIDVTKIGNIPKNQQIPHSDRESEVLSRQIADSLAVSKSENENSNLPYRLQDNSINVSEDTKESPSFKQREPFKNKKENGVSAEKDEKDDTIEGEDNGGIVDLDDDSEDEIEKEFASRKDKEVRLMEEKSDAGFAQSASSQAMKSNVQISLSCSDSDGAVIIGSDSENETVAPVMHLSPKKSEFQVIDDDDDDCVVIEDDTPAVDSNDLNKRKNIAVDAENNSDDSQPPSKRQRGISSTCINQITIKDARSLMPQEATVKKPSDTAVYPINITPASSFIAQGPPKLVPVSGNVTGLPLSGMPGMNANSNLLPGLTDDMYVLEAPSFIVPYIYEKPPVDNLKNIVKEIESKYKLTREDLADADKADEFDMMTEQNKEEKDDKSGKKKKKRRGGDDNDDDSWSEETEEDDDDEDDDDSESGVRTKVLIKEASDDLTALKGAIKPAAAVAQSTAVSANVGAVKAGQENYFESPLGKFFMDIGVGLVQEFVQSDLIRLQKRKMRKSLGKNIMEFERAIAALSGNLEASKKKNAAFKFTMKRCEFCNFKSESALAMANHYETPHMNGPLYKCNFCTFEIRNATEIVYHMEAVHNIKARLIKPLPYHQCPNCGFEDNGKAKLARHQPVCAKKFRPEINLSPPNDWEAPAKIPRIKPRHGLVGTATAYQAMAAQAAAQKAALASIQQQQQQVAQARSLQAAAIAAQNAANKFRGRLPVAAATKQQGPNGGGGVMRGSNQVRNPMATNVVLPNNYQLAGGQLMQAANAIAKKSLSGQPSISITPLPRQTASAAQSPSTSSNKMPPAGIKPGQSPSGGNKAQFVICEICDGYIKDLEQLRNHMQWMHKVKIHPKMIYNRPPLNCQKCQFRFFTDQGLERHLLGSHGLVTSSMQEAANKGKDAGRCPVCGRMYQWKLLNHVSRDHHMTLKPAHLSYKCTVCTATFGMYKQFETHVYTAHSTVAKKAMDGKKNNSVAGSVGSSTSASVMAAASSSGGLQRNSLSVANDSLLKPLKINDEITIIPQPASKPRITNMESHIID